MAARILGGVPYRVAPHSSGTFFFIGGADYTARAQSVNLVNRQLVGKERVEACVGERATDEPKVSDVSLQKLNDRAEHRAFQHLLKSTPLHPHDLRDVVDECHHLRVVARIQINAA
jgi:hypothetical protein